MKTLKELHDRGDDKKAEAYAERRAAELDTAKGAERVAKELAGILA